MENRDFSDRERCSTQRFEREVQQCEFGVITRNAVGADGAAPGASVDDGPLAVIAYVDAYGFHRRFTCASAIAWLVIDVS